MLNNITIEANISPRGEHIISRSNISENGLKVLYRLKNSGFQAYLVGGSVRDLLLGREPKDFDVATDARPEQVRKVFRNCRLIGRRFRLAHVHFGREIIEVATFRGSQPGEAEGERKIENGRLVRDNVFGTLEEDALRRDFTVNALYYNIEDFSVVDFLGGMADLESGRLRLIGDPVQRYREDPVRMLRAIRFASKLGFTIDSDSEHALAEMGNLLQEVPPARLFDELLKLFHGGTALDSFEKLRHYGLFGHLFPATEESLSRQEHDFPITFVSRGLANTDKRIQEHKPITPAFLFSVLLWEPVRLRYQELLTRDLSPSEAMRLAGGESAERQQPIVSIPKRFALPMREIWHLQNRFELRGGKRPYRLLTHPRFRAAYDFLLLRAAAGEVDTELADWWTQFQVVDAKERGRMTEPGRRKRRRRRRNRAAAEAVDT